MTVVSNPAPPGGFAIDLESKHLVPVWREPQFEKQSLKAHERAVHQPAVVHPQLDSIPLCPQRPPNGPQVPSEVVHSWRSLQGEAQNLRVARRAVEETESGPTMEGKSRHRPGVLRQLQQPSVPVLAGHVLSLGGRGSGANQVNEMVFHSLSYSVIAERPGPLPEPQPAAA